VRWVVSLAPVGGKNGGVGSTVAVAVGSLGGVIGRGGVGDAGGGTGTVGDGVCVGGSGVSVGVAVGVAVCVGVGVNPSGDCALTPVGRSRPIPAIASPNNAARRIKLNGFR